jgi:NitT/TauT family transport system substrate-binding protein
MKISKFFYRFTLFCLSLVLAVSCNSKSEIASVPETSREPAPQENEHPIIMGCSHWSGWWHWAIAEKEGLFEKNGVNVDLRWFDSYASSLEGLAYGQLDANCQRLNDTISFATNATNGEVIVLVNDHSVGNDQIIARKGIETLFDLKGKEVGVEAGLVSDFLLSLALEEVGMSRDDVKIIDLETSDAAQAFFAERLDAVGTFPPFLLKALERQGSHELINSAAFPGAIPSLLVTTQTLVDEHPTKVQGLVNTWFDVLRFIENNPIRANEILAEKANITIEELQRFKQGTKILTLEENLAAFREGSSMKHLPYATETIAELMLDVDFISEKPDFNQIFDDSFVRKYRVVHQLRRNLSD